MEKFLVSIEFRYRQAPKGDWDSTHKEKKITIGVFDIFDEAIEEGNKALECLESKFDLHVFPGGIKAKKERFSKTGGCFGTPNKLVTDLAHIKTPFSFFAKIETLKYLSVNDAIDEIIDSIKNHTEYKKNND